MAKFDYKKMFEKGLWGLGYAIVTGLLVMWQDDARFVVAIPLLMMVQNYIKHR
jgi:hypothetical protein